MDYEEKYKEALERATIEYKDEDRHLKASLERIFHELKDSEDEKIRKKIIKLVKEHSVNHERCQMETWLEKQGEQKPVPAWMPKFLDELRSKKNYFDWDEHKNIEGQILAIIRWMNPNYFNVKDRILPQLKQEWSEEDEKMIDKILKHFEWTENYRFDKEDCEGAKRWLKSLRPQSTWKPSEGQLECLGYAIDKAEKYFSPLANNRIYLTLKALKEQLEKL